MDKNIKHTFAIMAYGNSDFLEESINAVLTQSGNSKVIMTSSTPSEFQEKMAGKYDIPYIINPDRRGFSGDLNFAYAQAETPYVTLCHQDDLLLPGYCENCIEALDRNKDSLFAFTDYQELKDGISTANSTNIRVKKMLLKVFYLFGDNLRNPVLRRLSISFGNPIPVPNIMYNKKNIGDFEFSHDYQISPEWEALIRLAKMPGSFVYIREALHHYRLHGDSITSERLDLRIKEDRMAFGLLWPKPVASLLARLYSKAYDTVPGKD